jgi:hypothetical protein
VSVLYAATGNHVVRLEQQESSRWESTVVLRDLRVQCVAVDPDDPARIFAGTFDDGLYRSHDGGESWEEVSPGIPHNRFPSVAISPSHKVDGRNAVYAGTEPSSLYVSEDDGAKWTDLASLREIPSAPTWSFPPRPWTSHVRWIALSYHEPALIFAGIELGGVMRSTDGGKTWEDRKPGSYHDSHCILTHPEDASRVYEVAGGGVAWSHDAGETWQPIDGGMDRHYAWALAVDPEDPDRWYVSAAPGPRNAHQDENASEAVLFRKIGDQPWEPMTNGLGHPMTEMPYALLIPRGQPSTIYAGTRQGHLLTSSDRGDTWQTTNVELDGILGLQFAR